MLRDPGAGLNAADAWTARLMAWAKPSDPAAADALRAGRLAAWGAW